jgi:hypothetical protein
VTVTKRVTITCGMGSGGLPGQIRESRDFA